MSVSIKKINLKDQLVDRSKCLPPPVQFAATPAIEADGKKRKVVLVEFSSCCEAQDCQAMVSVPFPPEMAYTAAVMMMEAAIASGYKPKSDG